MINRLRVSGAVLALMRMGAVVAALLVALSAAAAATPARADTSNSGSEDSSTHSGDATAANSVGGSASISRAPSPRGFAPAGTGPSAGQAGNKPSDSGGSLQGDAPEGISSIEAVPDPAGPASPQMSTGSPTTAGHSVPSAASPVSRPAGTPASGQSADAVPPSAPSLSTEKSSSGADSATPHRVLTNTAQPPSNTTTSQPVARPDITPSETAPDAAAKPQQASSAAADAVGPMATPPTAPLDNIAAALAPNPSAGAPPSPPLVTVALTKPSSAPPPATVINLIGSIVFNLLGVAIQVFAGPPVLPHGSTVTVRSSTLTLPGTGQTVPADWYFPNNGDTPTRLIYFQHGFLATASMYSYTAAFLAESTDSIVVAPSLSSNLFDPRAEWIGGAPLQQAVANLFVGNRDALTASASAAAGHPVVLPTEFVLVGHSLGGALVTAAAGYMVNNGAIGNLAGVVLLDSVDKGDALSSALQKLTGANHVPVLDISSERYVWNLDGIVGDELQAARPGQFNGVMLVNGHHIDALQGGNPLIQFSEYLVAGFSQPQNIEAVKTIAAGWINDLFAGTHNGIYGAPQQSIEIPTSAGTATAVVLPFTTAQPVQVTPWDGLSAVILSLLFSFAVYEPLAGYSPPAAQPAPTALAANM